MGFIPDAIIVPGLGGSCLYDDRNRKIWPPAFFFGSDGYDLACLDGRCSSKERLFTAPLGDLDGIRYGNWLSRLVSTYNIYDPLIDRLLLEYAKHGEGRVSPFPYDFRLLLEEHYLDDLYRSFATFIERRNRPVVVYCHSLGGLVFRDFLLTRTDAWIRHYVRTVVYVNTPFDGSLLSLKVFLREHTRELDLTTRLLPGLGRFGGLFWCLPWYHTDRPILVTGSHTYRVGDTEDLFRFLSIKERFPTYQDVVQKRQRSRLVPLKETRSVFVCSSYNVPTPVLFTLDKKHGLTTSSWMLGDGVVTHESMTLPCAPDDAVFFMNDTHHSTLFQKEEVLEVCVRILLS
jgi:hypothetical protein